MNIRLLKLISFTFFLSVFFSGCVKSDSEKTVNEIALEQKTSNIKESENSRVKDDGWSIPDVKSAKKVSTSKIKLKDKSGIERYVDATNYSLKMITDEPYKFINPKFGKIQISSFRELKINNKPFAYVVNAQRAKYEESKKDDVGYGMVIIFSYFDKDGDGKFESFLKNTNDFLVPDWVL